MSSGSISVKRLTKEDKARLLRKRQRDFKSWGKDDRTKEQSVSLGERCYLARLSAGYGLKEFAKMVGISHVALIKRERNRGEVEELAKYWGIS